MKFYEKLQAWLAGPFSNSVQKFVQNSYMMALQGCFQATLPMIIVGSLASLINNIRNFIPQMPDLTLINTFTFGLISIYMAFIIPYNILENKGIHKAKPITGFTGLALLLCLCNPQFSGGNIEINSGYIGTGGMTVAVALGLALGFSFSFYFNHSPFKKVAGLPPIVVTWFETLIPIFLATLACILIGQSINLFTILEVIFQPVIDMGNSWIGFVLIYFIMSACYCLGLSAWAIWPIASVLFLTNIAANAALVAEGQAPIYISTDEVVFMGWCCVGGMGCTLVLNIMMITSKSKKISVIGKAALVPSIFNINEPVMYGLPVVWNPIMMIPFLIVAIVVPSITYLTLKIGLVAIPAVPLMMNYIPQPISAFIINNDWRSIILLLVVIIVTYLIYLPFFKTYEKQEIAKEREEMAGAVETE
jgi:PTS system cellobiose-specific IIC component